MKFAVWKVGSEEFKLKLSTGEIERLERAYGMGNLLNPLMQAQGGALPGLSYMLDILHGSMQRYQHGYSRPDIANLYDDWCEQNDGNQTELLKLIMEVFQVSGFFPTDTKKSKLKVVDSQQD